MIIKELPQDIQDVVKLRCEEQRSIFNAENDVKIHSSGEGFNWSLTKEDYNVWQQVNQGNYETFYKINHKRQPKFGEMVLVSDVDDIKKAEKRIFLGKIEQTTNPFKCVDIDYEHKFKKGLNVVSCGWQYMWQIPQETEQEIKIKEFEAKIAEMQKELQELKKLK